MGGAQPNINQGIVRQIEIPLPPIKDQESYVDFIKRIRSHKDQLCFSLIGATKLQSAIQHQSFAVN